MCHSEGAERPKNLGEGVRKCGNAGLGIEELTEGGLAVRGDSAGTRVLAVLARAEAQRMRKARISVFIELIGWLLLLTAVVSCVPSLFFLPVWGRYLMIVGLPAALFLLPGKDRFFLLGRRDAAVVASILERIDESLLGKIRTAVDLARHVPPGTSTDLVALAEEATAAALDGVEPAGLLGSKKGLPWRPAAFGLGAALFMAIASGGQPLAWMQRCAPWLDPPPPLPLWLTIAPGDSSVAYATSVTIRAELENRGNTQPFLVMRRPGIYDTRLPLNTLSRQANRDFLSHSIGRVKEPFNYMAVAGDDSTEWFGIHVYESLRLVDASLQLHFPAYTGQESLRLSGFPSDIRAVEGTRAVLSLATNNPLQACMAVGGVGDPPESLLVDDTGARWRFGLFRTSEIRFEARDRWGQEAQWGPIKIRPVPDRSPVIQEVLPGRDVDLGRDLAIDLGITASDDYGLTAVSIRYAIHGREDTLLLGSGQLGKEGTWQRRWLLDAFDLLPEDVVAYRFAVTDNNVVTGPNTSFSDWYRLRFPTLSEIMARLDQDQSGIIDSLQAVSENTQEIYEELKELSVEMAGSGAADWAARQNLRELADKQEELGAKLGELAQELAELQRRTEEEELFPAELLEKVSRVHELLHDLDIPELKRSLEELQEALDKVDQKDIERALNRLSSHQEDILKSLDRAVELLERLQMAQRLSHLAREAERLAADQETLMEDEEYLDRSPQEAGKKEQQMAEDLLSLEQGMEEMTSELEQHSAALSDSMAAALDRARESAAQEALEQAATDLQEGDVAEARPHQDKALSGLQQLSADLQAMEMCMQGGESRRIAEALSAAEEVVSELSFEQEELFGSKASDAAQRARQVGIADALREVREQVEEVFAQGTGMGSGDLLSIMASAQNQVDQAVADMGEKAMSSRQRRALSSLNTVSAMLASLRQQMEQSSSSCAGGNSMEQLFGLSQQQGQLNNSCSSLLPQAGQLSQEMLSALAARQQWIHDQLARFSEERGGRDGGGVLGDLGEVGREMEEVVGQLERSGLGEDAVNTQRRILSRLLDAQRSLRRQGLARRRRSKPASGPHSLRTTMTPVQENLPPKPSSLAPPRREDRYPPLYKELIDAYFRALGEE